MTGRLAFGVVMAVIVAGCGTGPSASGPLSMDLTVAAASSLRDAVTALTGSYAADHLGITFTVTTDSSATIRSQIEQGAPVDVFLSADAKNPQALADGGLAQGVPVTFAANSLALVVPTDNPAGITAPADLARPGVRVVGAADSVPIAAYTARVIEGIAASTGDPRGFVAAVEANVVSREQNVAAVLARIELGDGDAAFVYATDVASGAKVATIPVPAAANVRVECAGVVVKGGSNTAAAGEFLAWVAGEGGRMVLSSFGFLAP